MTPASARADLILLGAGHAHVEVLRRFAMNPVPGLRTTLIAREPHTPYSGALPALLRGECSFDEAHIDLAPLAAAAGARLLLAEADALDLAARGVRVAGRPPIPFDLLSLNLGGTPLMPPGAGIPVKPIGRFLERLAALEVTLAPGAALAVVGAGPAGVELALALAVRLKGRARLVLVGQGAEVLPAAPRRARRLARLALERAGVVLRLGAGATGFDGGRLLLADGGTVAAAAALWASGVGGAPFLAAAGLACDALGCVRVGADLMSLSHQGVFAAGDCAAFAATPRPKAGVWAVRAGPVLAEGLRAAALGAPLPRWRPQRAALAILGLGDGTALAWRGRFTASGRAVQVWKERIDRRWMAQYASARPTAMAAGEMRCGGCGAKIEAETLSIALAGLAPAARPDIPVGLAEADDAAVTLPPAGRALVSSVDFFRAFLDDPFVFGEIAAAHALSDLYAMGAAPWTALAIATLPPLPPRARAADLAAMMQGAGRVLEQAGCALVGGHSAEAAEMALGFSVTGLADPGAIARKGGLAPGDLLVLTKPLGTGIVLAAAMRGLARGEWLAAAIASMRRTNAEAGRIFAEAGARAITDVTGFGLALHLREMLVASAVAARLDRASLPALPGARELAARGVASSLAPANEAAGDALLADPQTSGGLLAGLPPACAAEALARLGASGHQAALIGEVLAGPAGALTVAG